jgi:hypothetical protein
MEHRALTVRDLIEELQRQDPDLKVKSPGGAWILRIKYQNTGGKPAVCLVASSGGSD